MVKASNSFGSSSSSSYPPIIPPHPPPPPRSPVIQKRYNSRSSSLNNGNHRSVASASSTSRSQPHSSSSRNRYQSRSNSNSYHQTLDSTSISNSTDQDRPNPLSTAALASALNTATELRFSNHGKYISRHPIRVLLLCSLVITSLFYPAVGIYFWSSKGGPGVTRGDAASVWKSLSTPFMDSFISGREHHNSIRDLRMIWDDSKDLKALDIRDFDKFGTGSNSNSRQGREKKTSNKGSSSLIPSVASPDLESTHESKFRNLPTVNSGGGRKPKNCRTIRIEHVFVTADDILKGSGPKHGVLQIPILSSALQLQQTIESATLPLGAESSQREEDEENPSDLADSPPQDVPSASSPEITTSIPASSSPSSSSAAAALSKSQSSLKCIRSPNSQPSSAAKCLTLSPLDYFDNSLTHLKSLESPERIPLTSSKNHTLSGIPLSITTTLAGRWHLFSKLPRAEHLAFTFFLEADEEIDGDEDCSSRVNPNVDRRDGRQNYGDDDEDQGKDDYHLNLNPVTSSSTLVSEPTSDRLTTKNKNRWLQRNDGFVQRKDGISKQHSDWMKMLKNVTNGQVRIIPSEHTQAKELLLHFTPKHPSAGLPYPQLFLSFAYLFVLVYIIRGLINTRRVHSRFGIAFTGAVELLISMIMSISLCGLLGIRLNLVPFEILPFVIVVIGSENMSVLIDAIVNTPVSLNVPARIAKGLRKVGVSISVTVVSDIVLLGIIANVVMVDAVKEFCTFAIFSLVMDYFMQMTFFITVLSIDMQRLELADLLSQGEGGSNSGDLNSNEANSISSRKERLKKSNQSPTSSSFIKTSCRAVWRARTARTASLSLMLALLFGLYLYYGTGYPSLKNYSFDSSGGEDQALTPNWISRNNGDVSSISDSISISPSPSSTSKNSFDPLSHLSPDSIQSDSLPWWSSSPSANFWKALNPNGSPQVKIIIEPWTILSLRAPNPKFERHLSFAGWALFRPRIRAFIWFSKLVVLPIAGTTALLWCLLLYLLKDTEILEAQFDKDEADSELESDLDEQGGNQDDYDDDSFKAQQQEDSDWIFDLTTSKNSHSNDVDILSESNGMIFSKDLNGNFGIWRGSKKKFERFNLQTDNNLPRRGLTNDNQTTSLCCDSKAKVLAIGQNDGKVILLNSANLKPFWSAFSDYPSNTNGRFTNAGSRDENQLGLDRSAGLPTSRVQLLVKHSRNSFLEKSQSVSFLSIHRDGSAWEWISGGGSPQLRIAARSQSVWNAFEIDGVHGLHSDARFKTEEEVRNSFDDGTERNERGFERKELVAMTSTLRKSSNSASRLEVYERDVGEEAWRMKLGLNFDLDESSSSSIGNSRASLQFKVGAVFEMKLNTLPFSLPQDQARSNSILNGIAADKGALGIDASSSNHRGLNSSTSQNLANSQTTLETDSQAIETLPTSSIPLNSGDDISLDDNSSSTSPSTLTLSPTNRPTELLALGDSSGRISIIDFASGRSLEEVQLNDGPINKIRVVHDFQRSVSIDERNDCLLIVGTDDKTWILQVSSSSPPSSTASQSGPENLSNPTSGHSKYYSTFEGSNSGSEIGLSPDNSPPRSSHGLPSESGGTCPQNLNGKRPTSPRQPKVSLSLPQTGSNFLSSTSTPNLSVPSNSTPLPPPPSSPSGRDSSHHGHSRSTSHQSTSTSSEFYSIDSSHASSSSLNGTPLNPNLLSFPSSSHGASRRRLSGQSSNQGGRSGSGRIVGEFNERGKLLDEEVFLRSGAKNENPNGKEGVQVRSLGFISTFRGGFDLIQDSILIGVRRATSATTASSLSNGLESVGGRLRKRISTATTGEKWQAWTLDLRSELDSLTFGSDSLESSPSFPVSSKATSKEVSVKSQGLRLNGEPRLRPSLSNGFPSGSASSSQLRFRGSNPLDSNFNQLYQKREETTDNISFNRLRPVTRTSGKVNDSLIFGFGNSIARLSIKEAELDRRKGSITKSNSFASASMPRR